MYLSSGIQHVNITWPTYCNVQQGFPLLSSEHLSEGASSLVPYVQGMLPMWPCNNELSITWKCTLLPLCSGGREGGEQEEKILIHYFCICTHCSCVHVCKYVHVFEWVGMSAACVCMCVNEWACVWTCVHVCACMCIWVNVPVSVVFSWKEGDKEEREVFLSLHLAHVHVLFIQRWAGSVINMHMYTMYLPIHKVLQPLQCFSLPLLVLHDFLNVVHSYHPVRRVDQKIAV